MGAGKLDRRIQFKRFSLVDDGFAQIESWAEHGSKIWASKKDINDGERARGGEITASLTARFVVRCSTFTLDLTAKDAIEYHGVDYEIFGIKEIGRGDRLEITAGAEVSNGSNQA